MVSPRGESMVAARHYPARSRPPHRSPDRTTRLLSCAFPGPTSICRTMTAGREQRGADGGRDSTAVSVVAGRPGGGGRPARRLHTNVVERRCGCPDHVGLAGRGERRRPIGRADVDHNGCDTRNDILARDLSGETFKPGTHDCVVLTGTLADPYSGTTIQFQRGEGTSDEVQIDHVVALSDAWQKGAQTW